MGPVIRLYVGVVAAAAAMATACDRSSPVAPIPQPAPSANQAPALTAGAVSPALGIDDLTMFTVTVEVRDPDGDSVSLRASGCSLGQNTPVPLSNGVAVLSFTSSRSCGSSVTFEAADSRGATASASVTFHHTALRGWYRLVIGERFSDSPFFFVNLEQSGANITGSLLDLRGHSGVVDPHEPGSMAADGTFRIRFKIQSEGDMVVTGRVLSSDPAITHDVVVATGTVVDGLNAGRGFKLWRESQF